MDQVSLDVAPIDVVESFEYHIKVRIWPHCEVIALLKHYRERNLNQNMGLQVTPTTGHSDRFIEGARIIVQLVQAGYDGYLYVDYYTAEGQAVHLYPNPGEPDSGRVLRGCERFTVGESARAWSVGPPFGQQLITVSAEEGGV